VVFFELGLEKREKKRKKDRWRVDAGRLPRFFFPVMYSPQKKRGGSGRGRGKRRREKREEG
jgi:hypothetical protein